MLLWKLPLPLHVKHQVSTVHILNHKEESDREESIIKNGPTITYANKDWKRNSSLGTRAVTDWSGMSLWKGYVRVRINLYACMYAVSACLQYDSANTPVCRLCKCVRVVQVYLNQARSETP